MRLSKFRILVVIPIIVAFLIGIIVGVQIATSAPNAVIVRENITAYPVVTTYINDTGNCGALNVEPNYTNSTSYVVSTVRTHVSITTFVTTVNSTMTTMDTNYKCPYIPPMGSLVTVTTNTSSTTA